MPQTRRVRSSQSDERERETVRPVTSRRRQAQQQLQQQKKISRQSKYNDENKSAPLLLKLLSWMGIILIFFVIGYLGTSWVIKLLGEKLMLKPDNLIENQQDLTEYQEKENEKSAREALNSGENIQQISLNLHHVKNDTIAETRKNFISRTKEDNIRDAIEEILLLSEVPNASKIKLLHVFRNNETAFLDMSGQFASSLDSMGQRKSQLLLTGLVRTLQENFSPITQIRFLIDSKTPKSGGTVNLSATWKMPKRS